MTKPIIIGVVAALVIAGGGAAYIATRDGDDSNKESGGQSASENAFAPVATSSQPFVATITVQNGTDSQAKFEHDGEGRTRYTATQEGRQMQFIYTMDAYYSCTGDDCVKFPLSQSQNSGFDPDDYEYGGEKLSGYRDDATYKGQQDCPAGTCDVWSVSTGGATTTFYVDERTKRINQVETTQNGQTSKIVYEYKDVTINVPTNAQELPTQ